MKKKVFSLMMTLLLAFMGVAKAETVEIGSGSSGTTYYVPFNSLYNYSFTEQVFLASEIGAAGNITSISFNLGQSYSSEQTNQIALYMKNVSRSSFSSTSDYEAVTAGDIVYSGLWTIPANYTGWVTVTLDTPFAYDGTSNLLVAMHESTSDYSTRYFTYDAVTNGSVQWYSDSYNPDPYNLGSYSGSSYTRNYRSNIQLDITAGGGGGVPATLLVHDGTATNGNVPVYGFYADAYLKCEMVYPAAELSAMNGGTINGMTFYATSPATEAWTSTWQVFVSEVADATISSFYGPGTVVYEGALDGTGTEMTINFTTPYQYNGGNLLVGVYNIATGNYKSVTWAGESVTGAAWQGYNYSSLSAVTGSAQNFLPKTNFDYVTAGGGSTGPTQVIFAVQDEQTVDTVFVGPRPNGAWMEPFKFQIRNTGAATTINHLDWTPEEYFTLVAPELPVNIARDEDIDVLLNTSESENTEWQMVALYGNERTAAIWTMIAEPYDPAVPDVVEMAYDLGTVNVGFSYTGVPSQITPTVLHNDYTLPFPEIPEGEDAVYKFTVENDVIISAWVDSTAENGKVALYTEDFYGEGGPMATNNYTGLSTSGGGAAATPFEVQIGEGTTTTTYFPFYTFYNYCIAENLFLAAELAEAGVTTAPMTSLSWYATNAPGYNQQGITIWMANVEDETLTTTSHPVTGMTKVYTGAMTPAIGWNEFVFNEGTFSWDGHSNVLIYCQRNNGEYNSSVSWQATASLPFNAMSYRYQDSGAYDPTIGNTMYTSTTRPNVIMKGGNRDRAGREIVTIGEQTGSSYYYYPANMYFNYSFGEQIYTADEIGTAGTINSISFYYNYSSSFTMNNLTLFMKHTDKEEFASTTDMEAMSLSDIVWSGNMSASAAGWVTINLDTPFQYNGTSNLMVGMFDGTSGYPGSSYVFYTHTTTGTKGLTWYSDSYTPDPYTLGSWSGSTNRTSYVNDIQLDITPGGGSAANAGPVITDLGLTPGAYYLVASATQADYTVYINIDEMPCPATEAEGFAFNPEPADDADEIEPASVTLRWMVPEYATGWRLVFGSTYYPDPNHPQTIIYPEDGSFSTDMANSYTVRNLWNNTNYFWHVEFNNTACPEGVSSPIWGFTTHLNVPQNLTAVDETVFDDEQIVLNWTAVVDRTYRFYNVYRDGELIGNTQVNNISNTTYTDGPLEYNMNGYTYYVTAVYDEGESAPSNTVNVKVSGYGNVNGHVYEQDGTTGIAGATVTMVGHDEFNVAHTYNLTTNNQGYYTGHIYAGEYNGQAAKEGYQTIYEPVQGNPIDITYNQTTSPIDYMLDENFDPVCQVIAEYYPDSLDPESPYVKVYWGCGLPGSEIIEDFETGDFSMFDWQVDGNYPWSITTYQPYEGTYCMKSGGAGVPSVVSNMTVSVEIPADGIMSYFGKISCESNWDYGYFYIDGVQKAQYTGVSNWAEKKFDITAGTHTFQWQYTKDGSVDSNDDCFYVDYITFYKQPEPPQPAQPGWHTYAESDFNNAVGSNVGTSRWAYEYPVSILGGYAGFTMTKVSLFSDNMYSAVGGNYTCTIYQGGTEPMTGTAVSTITVDVPQNMNAWVDFDLTTPVAISGTEKLWVVWTANSALSSWPAGCCDGLVEEGTWWNAGLEAGYDWEHETYGTWTMRQYFTNRGGEGFYSYASDNAPVKVEAPTITKGASIKPVKGVETVTTLCANPNAERIGGGNATRRFSHYRVYRTDCYNDGPYTLYDPEAGEYGNTVVLACELHDTIYIDVDWPDVAPGVYKWGVGCVYVGNRGEEIEGPISWAAPVVNRSFTTSEAAQIGPKANVEVAEQPQDRDRAYLQYSTEIFDGGVGTGGGAVYWGIRFPAADLAAYAGQTLTKVGVFMDVDGDYGWTYSGNYTARVFLGGATAPGTLVSETTEYLPGDMDWHDITLNTPVAIDGTQDLWLTFYTADIAYPMSGCVYTGEPNSDFLSLDGTTWDHSTDYALDYTWMIRGYVEAGGPTPPTPPTPGTYGLQEPRESEIVWSNCLDKDMYLNNDAVTVNVLLNSADSPEGIRVSFTNYNEAEQEMYPVEDVILDETGFYAFDSFRKGNYKVNVSFDGYEPIEDSVSIWEPTDLRYVMIEIIYGASNLYVSRTGWAMWEGHGTPGGGGGGGGQGGSGDTFTFDCDGGMPAGWTTVDADGDGYTWVSSMTPGNYHNPGVDLTGTGHNASTAYVISGSYANGTGQVLYPDNYLVSPQVNLVAGSTFSFWACAQDASYAAEHFGVAVSNNGTSDWTMVDEWTLTAKGGGVTSVGRDGNTRVQGNWYQKTVDLSAFAGQKYIAIRHFNCHDEFILNVDDIELNNGAKGEKAERHFEYYKVMCESIDHEPIFNVNTIHPFCQVATDALVEGEHYICKVAAMYSTGMSDWIEAEWEYEPCEHWDPIEGLEVTPENEGNHLTWEFAGGGGGGGGGGGTGDTFTVDFDNSQMPAGWTAIDGGSPSGYGWQLGSTKLGGTGNGHNGSADLILSQSYDNNYGVVYPDNWFISPAVTLGSGSTFSFWACGQDAGYAAEHCGVFVSTTGTNPSDFTMVNEWTLSAKSAGEKAAIRGTRDQGTWRQYTVELGAYAGAARYIAIRHFNCSDMFYLDVDDIELTNGAKGTRDVVAFNGFVTDPGAMANGADASWIKGSQSTWGPNVNNGGGYMLADVFTLSAATTISEIEVYGYQTGSSTTSTFTGLYAQIYNGSPMSGGTAVWGDMSTNIMTATAFTNCYRGSDGETNATTRPIMSITAGNLNISLEAGTYYLVYSLAGSGSSGPWGAPHAEPSIGNTGNGLQFTTAWQTLLDSGAGTPYGCAMKITGSGGGVTPTPVEGVLGFMVFRDGEWLAEILDPNAREYTDGDEYGEHEYCVRVIYDGTAVLPSNNYYYAMSCPVCEGGQGGCAAGAPIHGEAINATDQVRVWWGEETPGPGCEGDEFTVDFESGIPAGWTTIDADGDGYNWNLASTTMGTGYGHNGSSDMIFSQSYDNNYGALTPDNWLVTPTVTLCENSTFSFYACAQDNAWASEHFGVAVSEDNGNTFTMVQEWTLTAKGERYDGPRGMRDQGNWYQYTVDLGAYAGEGRKVAIRHFNCSDWFYIDVDDIQLTAGAKATRDGIEQYIVYRATSATGEYVEIGTVPAVAGQTYYEYLDTPETGGTYYYQVRADYGDCLSEPAQSYDNPSLDYVMVGVTGIGENDGMAIFPNPTKGNVTIQVAGMQHITVVSVLGQVVYDADVDTDEVILNMSKYTAGMYTVRVMTENGVRVERITVVR